jgi:hypothetical protein
VVRLDGEFGWARGALQLREHEVGYLMRCSDRRWLDAAVVQQALATTPERFEQTDTGTVREVYDVGWVPWSSEVDEGEVVTTRLVVTRMRASGSEVPKVGTRRDDWIYELFVTDRAPEALGATDVLELYFARGGFEQTLAEEDREIDPDRWVSGHPQGQELWQILAQWVWNLRLQLGLVAAPCAPRVTRWSKAPTCSEVAAIDTACVAPPEDATLAAPRRVDEVPSTAERVDVPAVPIALDATAGAPQASTPRPEPSAVREGFVLQSDGTLLCPAGKRLRRAEVRRRYLRFRARDADCRECPRKTHCLRQGASGQRGRRVDWPTITLGANAATHEASSARAETHAAPPCFKPPARPGPEQLYWHDLPATALRRSLPMRLRQQRIEGLSPPIPQPPPVQTLDREQRAHRRLRWCDRLTRNARPTSAPAPHLHLHGVPERLAAYLGIQVRR